MAVSRALLTSKSDRWFTPPDLLADVAAFLGADYFDPCPARREGERIEDGLGLSWSGKRVFCNPPYGRVIGRWVDKAMTEDVDEIVLLLPSRTGAAWFQRLLAGDGLVLLLIAGRLRFSGAVWNAPFDSVLAYRRPRVSGFVNVFGRRGAVLGVVRSGVSSVPAGSLWEVA